MFLTILGCYMELIKGLEEAKYIVQDKQPTPVGIVEHGSITIYLQIGIGYDYFCELPKTRERVYGHKYPSRLLQATFMQKREISAQNNGIHINSTCTGSIFAPKTLLRILKKYRMCTSNTANSVYTYIPRLGSLLWLVKPYWHALLPTMLTHILSVSYWQI